MPEQAGVASIFVHVSWPKLGLSTSDFAGFPVAVRGGLSHANGGRPHMLTSIILPQPPVTCRGTSKEVVDGQAKPGHNSVATVCCELPILAPVGVSPP